MWGGVMTLFKRHLGLRAGAAAVVSALVVLGLEAPASAAPPTISSFSPTSGPAECVVVITETNFKEVLRPSRRCSLDVLRPVLHRPLD